MPITKRLRAARGLRKLGCSGSIRGNSWTIAKEAYRNGVRVSLLAAVCHQETGWRNVYGHDPTIPMHEVPVNEQTYRGLKLLERAGHGQQGVGQMQLTSAGLQDEADRYGGCWVNAHNVRTGAEFLAGLIRAYGEREGVRHFNGSGPRAEAYASNVLAIAAGFHKRLTKG